MLRAANNAKSFEDSTTTNTFVSTFKLDNTCANSLFLVRQIVMLLLQQAFIQYFCDNTDLIAKRRTF